MRILKINGKFIEVQMDQEEFDRALWHELQEQWTIGYDCGRNDQAALDGMTKPPEDENE